MSNPTWVARRRRKLTLETAFGLVVRDVREGQKLSQEDLGFPADLHRTYISMLERGERCPSLSTIGKLAKGLHTKASALVRAAESLAEG